MKASDRFFVKGVTAALNHATMPVANLSVGGLFAATEDAPMQGQVVALQLRLGNREPFTVVGQVTWVNDSRKPKKPEVPPGFGVKITKIAFPDKLAILDLLKRSQPNER